MRTIRPLTLRELDGLAGALFDFINARSEVHDHDGLPERGVRWRELWTEGSEFLSDRLGGLPELHDFLRALALLVERDAVWQDLGGFWVRT